MPLNDSKALITTASPNEGLNSHISSEVDQLFKYPANASELEFKVKTFHLRQGKGYQTTYVQCMFLITITLSAVSTGPYLAY